MLRAGRVCRRINQIPRKGHGQRQRYRSYHGWRNNFRSERFSQYASHPTFSSAAWMVGALITGGLLLSMSPTVTSLFSNSQPAYADDDSTQTEEPKSEQQEQQEQQEPAAESSANGESEKRSVQQTKEDKQSEFERQLAELPKFDHIIVGGGVAAYEAYKTIREIQPEATVLIITNDELPPYERPPLTKDLWTNASPEMARKLQYINEVTESQQSIMFDPKHPDGNGENFFILRTYRAIDFSPSRKYIELDDGKMVRYDKLLIATGSSPIPLEDVPITEDAAKHVTTFHTARDFYNLYELQSQPTTKHITVVGGGFLGTELACALTTWREDKEPKPHVKVTQVVPENGVLADALPDYLSAHVSQKLKQSGIDVRTNTRPLSIIDNDGRLEVYLSDGSTLSTDHVVVAMGTKPNVQLAKKAFMEIDEKNGGIAVNSELMVCSDVYAAGDVASWWDPVLLTRRRAEHQDHAKMSGRLAAMNMTGARRSYYYVPTFWGKVGDASFEAAGIIDSKLETVGIWQSGPEAHNELIEEVLRTGNFPSKERIESVKREWSDEYKQKRDYERGVVYYLNGDKKVVGVLLWNVFGKLDSAQAIVERWRRFDDVSKLTRQISLDGFDIDEPLHK